MGREKKIMLSFSCLALTQEFYFISSQHLMRMTLLQEFGNEREKRITQWGFSTYIIFYIKKGLKLI